MESQALWSRSCDVRSSKCLSEQPEVGGSRSLPGFSWGHLAFVSL